MDEPDSLLQDSKAASVLYIARTGSPGAVNMAADGVPKLSGRELGRSRGRAPGPAADLEDNCSRALHGAADTEERKGARARTLDRLLRSTFTGTLWPPCDTHAGSRRR
jgi:hypothetical protein